MEILDSADGNLKANMSAYLEVDDKYVDLVRDTSKPISYKENPDKTHTLTIVYTCAEVNFVVTGVYDKEPMKITKVSGSYQASDDGNKQEFKDKPVSIETSGPNKAYECNAEQSIQLGAISKDNKQAEVKLVISKVLIEGFRDNKKPEFYQDKDTCDLDKGTSWGTIIFGILIALSIGGGIAYYVKSKRR